MASNAPREMQVLGASGRTLLCLVLVLFVRAWFDLAQARTVVDRVGKFKLSLRSFVLALRNLPALALHLPGDNSRCALCHSRLNCAEHSTQIFCRSWSALGIVTLVIVGIRLWQRAAPCSVRKLR